MNVVAAFLPAHIAELERATYVAWLVTGSCGFVGGVIAYVLFRIIERKTRMILLAATSATILGIVCILTLDRVRYGIEEAPFESIKPFPIYVHPGIVSQLLPSVALLAGVTAASATRRKR